MFCLYVVLAIPVAHSFARCVVTGLKRELQSSMSPITCNVRDVNIGAARQGEAHGWEEVCFVFSKFLGVERLQIANFADVRRVSPQ